MKPVYFFLILHICIFQKMLQAQTFTQTHCSHQIHFLAENEARGKRAGSTEFNALMSKYDVNFYKLDVSLTNASKYINGSGTIKAKVLSANLDTFAFELHQTLPIDSIFINKKKYLQFERSGKAEVKVKLGSTITKGSNIEAVVFYRGFASTDVNVWKLGFINETDKTYGLKISHSLSVPYSAANWWPCKQIITDLADSVEIWATIDTSLQVASNGTLTRVIPLANGKHRFEWKTRYPINYYLVSVAVAPYIRNEYKVKLDGETDEMLVQDFIYNLPQPQQWTDTPKKYTGAMLQNFSNLFGIYPFYKEKYGIYMLPLNGGMEHQTMSAIGNPRDKYLLAHEMAHQWFGDDVNILSFRDMWLNEGFASYCEYLTAEFLFPNEAPDLMNQMHSFAMSSLGGKVYVDDTLNFTAVYDYNLVYRKGAAIIHTMRFLVNDDKKFFGAIKKYRQTYSGKNPSLQNFKNLMEAETGVDLTDFFNQWYYGEGYPTFAVTFNQTQDTLKLKIVQTTSTTKTILFKTPIELNILLNEGDTTIRVNQNENISYFHLPVNGTVKYINVDPNNWLLNKAKSTKKDTSLSLPRIKKTGFTPRVYPNPNYGKLYIDLPENASAYGENLMVEIYNTTGQNRHTEKITNSANSIDISHFPRGLYIVVVKNASGVSSTSLVKL